MRDNLNRELRHIRDRGLLALIGQDSLSPKLLNQHLNFLDTLSGRLQSAESLHLSITIQSLARARHP